VQGSVWVNRLRLYPVQQLPFPAAADSRKISGNQVKIIGLHADMHLVAPTVETNTSTLQGDCVALPRLGHASVVPQAFRSEFGQCLEVKGSRFKLLLSSFKLALFGPLIRRSTVPLCL
jgi:hypothetical protein